MTLRVKVILAVGITLALLMFAVFATSRIILLNSFANLEQREVIERLQRGQGALSDEISRLNSVAGDWALWDDTFNFVEGGNEAFIQSNMTDDTLVNLRVNFMLFFDVSGRPVYSKAYDFHNLAESAVPAGLLEHLTSSSSPSALLRHADVRSSVMGVLYLPDVDDPLLVAARPITRSGGKGPIRGTLVMGRLLDRDAIAGIARLTHLDLKVSRFAPLLLPLSAQSPLLVRPVSDDKTIGYAVVTDVYAQPAMVMQVEVSPRYVYQQGQASLNYINSSLLIVGLVFIVVTVMLWDRLALSRLARLSADVSTIGARGNFDARVQVTGRDELSSVAGSINRMLGALAQSNAALRESEARFRRLAENAQDMIFRFRMSPSPGFEYVSPAAVQISGYAVQEFYVNPALAIDLVHPDDRSHFESITSSLDLLSKAFVLRWVRKDGEVIFIEQRNAPVYDEGGRLVAFEGIARDITERRLAEEAIRKSEERFRQQAIELRALYEASLQLGAQLDIGELLRVITEQAAELLRAQGGGLYLHEPRRNELALSYSVNYEGEPQPIKPGEGIIGQAFQFRRSMFWAFEQAAPELESSARLSVPLLGTDRVLGVLDVIGGEATFGRHEIQFAELFTAQAAVALEKAYLHTEVRRHVRQLAALNRADQAILSTLDLQAVLNLVIAESRALLDAEAVSVLLHDPATDELYFAAVDSPRGEQLIGQRMPASRGIAGWVMQHKQAVWSQSAYADPRFSAQIDEATGMTTHSLLAAPLMTKGAVLGVIEAINKVGGVFEPGELSALEAMAASAAVATENARLYQMEREQRELAETLYEVGTILVSTPDTDTVLDRLLGQVSRVVPYDVADIMLIQDTQVRVARWRGYERYEAAAFAGGFSHRMDEFHNLRWMAETGEPTVIPDTRADPNWIHYPEFDRLCSYAGAPIRVQNKVIGFLNVNSLTPGHYGPQHATRLRAFADQVAIALENARLFERERKTAERLQALSRRLVGVQEMERSRVARELHDEAGQALASLMVNLRLLEQEAGHPDRVIVLARQLKQMTDGVLEGLHRLAVDLRPASLDHLGLVAALRQYIETFVRQHHVEIQFEAVRLSGERMPMEVETALYRIVQEALTNVVRHARATQVGVILEPRGDNLVLIVEDNGIGFDLDAAVPGERLGLVGMKERAEMLGGTLEIESQAEHGTTIFVEVPYAHSNHGG